MKFLLLTLTLLVTPILQAQEPIRAGIIIHASGPLAASSQQSQAALKAYFDEINNKGGINDRKLQLIVATIDPVDIQRAAREQKVIAFVGGTIAGHEKPIGDVIRAEQVPLIGPSTLLPPIDPPLNRYGFYLMSGIREQARALVNFAAAKPELKNAPAAIVYIDDQLNTAGASAAEEQAIKLGWRGVTKSAQRLNDSQAVSLVQDFKRKRTQTVFFFGAAAPLKQLMQSCEASSITPTFLTISATSGSDLSGMVTPAFKDRFFLSFPIVPADMTAVEEYRALQQKYKLATTHVGMQFSTFAAAKVFIEALTRSGNNPSRAMLVTSLEQLKDFDTGYSPRVTFTKSRRVGAPGAHMITFDPETKKLVPLGVWVPAH